MMRPKFANLKMSKRSLGLIAAALIITGGLAFALLQSQAKLTGNSIQTESANLLISQNNTDFGTSTSGYTFTGIIPGSQASQTEHLFIKNTGTAPLAIKLSAEGLSSNPANLDLNKIDVLLSPYSTTTSVPTGQQRFTLEELMNADANGGALINYPDTVAPGATEEYDIQLSIEEDATTNSSVSLSNIDFIFTGEAKTAMTD